MDNLDRYRGTRTHNPSPAYLYVTTFTVEPQNILLAQLLIALYRTIEELQVKKRRLTEQSKDVVPETVVPETVVPDFLQNLLEQIKVDDCRVPEFTKPQGSYQLVRIR